MAALAPRSGRTEGLRLWVCLAILLLGSLVVFGFNLGANSLHNQDEAKHAVVAREAAVDGHWLPLTYNGRPYYNKPPLRIWLTAITFELAGVNEWAVRFWSAVAATATVLSLFLIGQRLFGLRAAFLGAFALLTSHLYIYNHCARTGETDALLIFFLSTGLLLFELALVEQRRGALVAAAVFVGLCGITKHLGFVPTVVLIAGAWVLLARLWSVFRLRTWLTAFAAMLAVALPWHLIQWLVEGKTFLQAYFLREVVERRLENAVGRQSSARLGHWVSVRTFANGFFPWSYLVPIAVLVTPARDPRRSRWWLPLIWLVVMLGSTVVSVQKFTWYVLPAFPAAALLVGGVLDRFLATDSRPITKLAVLLSLLVALASTTTAAVLDPFSSMARQSMLSVWTLGRLQSAASPTGSALLRLLAIAALCCLAYYAIGRWRFSERARRVGRRLLVAVLAGQALWIATAPLKFSRQRSPVHQMALLVESKSEPGEPLRVTLAGRKAFNPLFNFYLGRFDVRRFEPENLDPQQWAGDLLLTDFATLPHLQRVLPTLGAETQLEGRARGMLLYRIPPVTSGAE